MTGLPASIRLPRKPPGTVANGLGKTRRVDRWWVAPGVQATLFTVCATYLFISGILLTPLFGTPYEVDHYLSPLFSPLIRPEGCRPGSAPACSSCGCRSGSVRRATTTARPTTASTSRIRPVAPLASPPSIAATRWRSALPFILQNLHRCSCTSRSSRSSSCGWMPSWRSRTPVSGGSGLGVAILLVNAFLLTGYSLSCHSLRHLVGGRLDCFSCSRRTQVRYTLWQRLTGMNLHHMAWAWASLISVTLDGRLHPAAGARGHHRSRDPLLARPIR